MKYVDTMTVKSKELLPENLVEIFDIKIICTGTWTTPGGSGSSYEYQIHALFDDSLHRTKKPFDEKTNVLSGEDV